MNFENLKFYIRVQFKLGLTFNQIFKDLKTALLKSTPLLSKITRRFDKFKSGIDH